MELESRNKGKERRERKDAGERAVGTAGAGGVGVAVSGGVVVPSESWGLVGVAAHCSSSPKGLIKLQPVQGAAR